MSGWRRTRLKYLARCNERVLPESTGPDVRFRYVDISAVSQGEIAVPAEEMRFGDAPSRARRLARPGDTVISTVRTYLRAVAPVPKSSDGLVFSTGFAVLQPDASAIEPRFLTWLLQGDEFIDRVVASSTGVSYPAIAASTLMDLVLRVPPIHEQRTIADYLARETSQIDALIAKQKLLVATLRERRRAPEERHFASDEGKVTVPLKRVLTKRVAPPPNEAGVVTAYRDGRVMLRSRRRDDGYTFSETEAGYQGVLRGQVVFHGLDGFAGAVGIAEDDGKASPVYHVCDVVPGVSGEYVAALLRFLGVSGYLATRAPNVRQRSIDFRNWQTFARLDLSLAGDCAQQQALVDAWRIETAQFDELIVKAERFIVLAKERRAALVTAAVTGQIAVPGFDPAVAADTTNETTKVA